MLVGYDGEGSRHPTAHQDELVGNVERSGTAAVTHHLTVQSLHLELGVAQDFSGEYRHGEVGGVFISR